MKSSHVYNTCSTRTYFLNHELWKQIGSNPSSGYVNLGNDLTLLRLRYFFCYMSLILTTYFTDMLW